MRNRLRQGKTGDRPQQTTFRAAPTLIQALLKKLGESGILGTIAIAVRESCTKLRLTSKLMKNVEIVNIHQAKISLLERVELGEEVIISSNQSVPIAKLVPFHASSNRRASLGQDQGRFTVPEGFNAPLSEEILAAFKGDVDILRSRTVEQEV